MRMGTRWAAGDPPPAAVPASLHAIIAAVEADVLAGGGSKPGWTLTWLEGRPYAELDTGAIVTLDRDGEAVAHHDPDDEFA